MGPNPLYSKEHELTVYLVQRAGDYKRLITEAGAAEGTLDRVDKPEFCKQKAILRSVRQTYKIFLLYLHSPNTLSWRGAQLNAAQGQLYLYLFPT
jgi:hypothetical protein